MKYRTTKKDTINNYNKVICVGYCDLQTLLSHETQTAYTTRREGWAADVYDFGNTAIVTGYAPFGNIRPSYDIYQKYENAAKKIYYNYDLSWTEQKEQLRELIAAFIEEVQ